MKLQLAVSSFETLKGKLLNSKTPPEVITAILKAVAQGLSQRDPSGIAYARHMERAYDEYGIDGVKAQVQYLLLYLEQWQGEDAKVSKKILRKWAR